MIQDQYEALNLVVRLAERFGPSSRIAKELPGWLEYLAEVECPERPRSKPSAVWWEKVRATARDLLLKSGRIEDKVIERNIALLGSHFGLTTVETKILKFIVLYRLFDSFEHVVDGALETKEVSLRTLLSWFCQTSETEIRTATTPLGRLMSSGLVEQKRGGRFNRVPMDFSDKIVNALQADVSSVDDLIGILFREAPSAQAQWSDFESIATEAELVRSILSHALSNRTSGINVLLYGPPGTGKTEFAKVLAREVGACLRAVGEVDEYGGEPSRKERGAELTLACRLLGERSDTVLLFDEMEDFVASGQQLFTFDRPSKVHNNRALETNPIPVIWTTNSLASCDPAFLRRMSYSIHMPSPSGQIRSRIWQRLEARHRVGLSSAALTALSDKYDEAPALVSDAMQLAKLCDGGEAVLAQVLDASARLARGGMEPLPHRSIDLSWQTELANADQDLALIEARLSKLDAPRRISFCLDGPAGTGKSAWARHLARLMGMKVVEKRASDLMSKWVGESEQNIARAFAEARATNAMLIFDEADSLLGDRRHAERSWEVSQVNEMLTWMESHPLPFVCTTNFIEKLDPATQRRFTFRVRFNFLTEAQLPLAWAVHFNCHAPTDLWRLDRLAVGDFANVARRMSALSVDDPQVIREELVREMEAKKGATSSIGFRR